MSIDDNRTNVNALENGMHCAELFNCTYHLIPHLVSGAIPFKLLMVLYRVGLVTKVKYLFMHQEYG